MWQAICAIVPTTQYVMTHAARHCFTPNRDSSHLTSFVREIYSNTQLAQKFSHTLHGTRGQGPIPGIGTANVITVFVEINAPGALFLEAVEQFPNPINTHRFCVLLPLKTHCFWWAFISEWAFISANTV